MRSGSTHLLEKSVHLSSDLSFLVFEASQIMKTKIQDDGPISIPPYMQLKRGLIFELRKAEPDQGLK